MITAAEAVTRDISLVGLCVLVAPVVAMALYVRVRGHQPDARTKQANRFSIWFSGEDEVSAPLDEHLPGPEEVRRIALAHGYVWTATLPDRKGRMRLCFRRLPPPRNGSPWWEDGL
ncbi:hypothetical protein [Embleya sp. NBC_00896]|uniref:hypothetical protein n=1 Tax=Embleya sp. NBC_00896 TaxID=2975961 RepID=UPI003868A25E|nr:hypothetical protein OG928_23615 [Embleya sp. NBC_00896]